MDDTASSPSAGTSTVMTGRQRKRQKRINAIQDQHEATTPAAVAVGADCEDEEGGSLRRSTRVRRAPPVLDTSPVSSRSRQKKLRLEKFPFDAGESEEIELGWSKKDKKRKRGNKSMAAVSSVESDVWRSRLRDRVKVKKGAKRKERVFVVKEEVDEIFISSEEEHIAEDEMSTQTVKKVVGVDLPLEESSPVPPGLPIRLDQTEAGDAGDKASENKLDEVDMVKTAVPVTVPAFGSENGDMVERDEGTAQPEETSDGHDLEGKERVKEDETRVPGENEKVRSIDAREGRRCGLCGGGTDGRPPKILVHESLESENETYEGSIGSEELKYDVWDGFGDDPGWLGRLLGPIRDRFGITRVWVHQNCAVWSPEVYFSGFGCLKSVRAALYRGRSLKCSRCGRPGATIGCRVDRCPKTYHLPCSRAEACIFDHRKFLIACNDHRHLFQPQGEQYDLQIRRRKARKMRMEMRKISHDAWRKDVEAEEKWLENCGEDEEFLKREGKRLQRDLVRIAPVYIGGSSGKGKSYGGWESVAGLREVIQCMKEVVILPLLYPEVFCSLGLTPPRGVLLHGYPGTGKTLVVRALIGACSRGSRKIAYFARKGADCLGKYVGDAERQLRLLFLEAERSQPSIIFFDEIDGLAPCRSRQQDQTHNSVVSTLLSLLDGLKSRGSVIVIGATNRPDAVDPALRRPGRFDREIYFPLPTLEDRSAILSLHTKHWPHPVSGSLLSFIATQTVGYAGADLQAICTQAVMNALKRKCRLKELMSTAEKGLTGGKLPPLPSFIVEDSDWLAALAAAPPPCSKRESGIAANDFVSSPLKCHLVPCLIKPLLHLLVSLHLNERIWLPASLFKAAASIKNLIFSILEAKRLSTSIWASQLQSLLREQEVVQRLESILFQYGLISGQSRYGYSFASGGSDISCKKINFSGLVCTSSSYQDVTMQKSLAFHALISGRHRFGQQHLAACLLNGFMGQREVQKINLSVMSQAGNGDIVFGLTQTLSKCLNMGRCIIFMPRIDLWAIDASEESQLGCNGTDLQSEVVSTPIEKCDVAKKCSEAWNSFMELMNSSCTSLSVVVLATCEVQFCDLPLAIRQFFGNCMLDQKSSCRSDHTIPKFAVDIDGDFDYKLVKVLCAHQLLQDITQHYVQLLHQRAHDKEEKHHDTTPTNQKDESCVCSTVDEAFSGIEKLHTVAETPSREDSIEQNFNSMSKEAPPSSNPWNNSENNIQSLIHGNFLPRDPQDKAIRVFGYQILTSPQFSKLCWLSSKLKEGPSAELNGPWKDWPFNACIFHPNDVAPNASNLNNGVKEKELSGTVRGLNAVGILACKGSYKSVREVCAKVREVLELLVSKIRGKILEKKHEERYFPILSQMAYLDDIVSNWAYTFQSLPVRQVDPTMHDRSWMGPISTSAVENLAAPRTLPDQNCDKAGNHPLLVNVVTAADVVSVRDETGRPAHAGLDSTEMTWENSANLCLYSCCNQCLIILDDLVRDVINCSMWSNHQSLTVDDIHDALASCSLNLQATVRKLAHASVTQLSPKECTCHIDDGGSSTTQKIVLSFVYKNGLLMPAELNLCDSTDSPCRRFDRLCLYSLIESIKPKDKNE